MIVLTNIERLGRIFLDDHGQIFLEGCSWMVISGRTLIDRHFSENTHGRSFLEGRSWAVILVRTLMDGHFSKDAGHGEIPNLCCFEF